ncbi:MAG: amidase [Alphaproteobacteria bacterium]|nr:amidase [Alphaproteobacteria bacterium]
MTVPEEASIAELARLMADGALRSTGLVETFRERIEAEDEAFRSVAFLNPDALEIASERDRERAAGRVRGPMHGVPVLMKDNIATGDAMMTTAGSLALDGVRAEADSHVARRLRESGAVLLGKTNLSEWANFRSTRSSSGWSSRGGQVRNAYATDRTPGGSSSGSGVAVARDFAPAAIGTETDGSVVGPSAMNSIAGIKPTLGLVSRAGIVPIAASQDTAGPMARTVADAAILLGAISGADADDPASRPPPDADFTRFLDSGALRETRIGVVRNYCGFHEAVDRVFEGALEVLADAGAVIVDEVEMPSREAIRPHEVLVMRTEFKQGLNAWLSALGPECPVHSLAELIRFNIDRADRVMPWFGQEQLIAAEETDGLESEAYRRALSECRRLTRDDGIDRAMGDFRLDALVAPTSPVPWAIDLVNGDNRLGGSSGLAAVSGYPSVTVPAGYVAGLPVGLSFIGGAWRDGALIGYAHAFEQAAQARVPPGPARPWQPVSARSASETLPRSRD